MAHLTVGHYLDLLQTALDGLSMRFRDIGFAPRTYDALRKIDGQGRLRLWFVAATANIRCDSAHLRGPGFLMRLSRSLGDVTRP